MTFLDELKKQIVSTLDRSSCCRRAMLNGIVLAKGYASSGNISVSLGNCDAIDYTKLLVREVFGQEAVISVGSAGGRRRELSFRSPAMERYLNDAKNDQKKLFVKKCAVCEPSFMCGVFLAAGRMTSIDVKRAKLELSVGDNVDLFYDYFASFGIEFSKIERRNEKLLYSANSSLIGDFFAMLGLNSAAFMIINKKIEKEVINNTNRQCNCMMNNISKTVSASAKVLDAIKALQAVNLISTLPEELEKTAMLRLQYPDYTLARLAAMFSPPISKPGLSHRLNKIVEFADRALGKREN
jgi:DNA-binding transcriptional regulator WhiA